MPKPILLLYDSPAELLGNEVHLLIGRFGDEKVGWRIKTLHPGSSAEFKKAWESEPHHAALIRHTRSMPFSVPAGILLLTFEYNLRERGKLVPYRHETSRMRVA